MIQQRLQILRGIAALSVAISHLSHWFVFGTTQNPNIMLINIGAFSVAIFFVISGYIISFVHQKDIGHPTSLKAYGIKRIFRIYPAYFFFFVLAAALHLFFNIASIDFRSFTFSAGSILSAVTLFPFISHSTSPVTVAWSLYYEMLFYAVFLFLIIDKRLGISIGLLFFLASFFNDHLFSLPFFCINRMNLLFIAGGTIGFLVARKNLGKIIYYSSFVCGAILIFLALVAGFSMNSYLVYFGATLIVGSVAGLDIFYPMTSKLFIWKILLGMGAVSYSIYLGHISAQAIAFHYIGVPDTIGKCALFIICSVALASLAYYLVEKPAMDTAKKILNKGNLRALQETRIRMK